MSLLYWGLQREFYLLQVQISPSEYTATRDIKKVLKFPEEFEHSTDGTTSSNWSLWGTANSPHTKTTYYDLIS